MSTPDQLRIKVTPEITGQTPDLTIDNGEAPAIILPIYDIFETLTDCIGEDAARALLRKVIFFAKDVETEKAKGQHLGSSDLRRALKSTMFTSVEDRDPARYGLKTVGELALALEVIISKARSQESRVRVISGHQ